MRRFEPIVLGLLACLIEIAALAQSSPSFSEPVLALDGDYLVISYQIISATPEEIFHVRMEVSDSLGRAIIPVTVYGDIGEGVKGVDLKEIRWNIQSDRVSQDQVIYVKLSGKPVIIPEEPIQAQTITRMGAIGRSAIFPGWGLSRLHPGKPHWIKGALAYGAAGGALLLNQQAHANYQNYLDSDSETERASYYDRSVAQEQVSVVLAFTAAGIWAADLIWTLIATKGMSGVGSVSDERNFLIYPDYESNISAPLLTLRVTF
jgi:hypothetical protein